MDARTRGILAPGLRIGEPHQFGKLFGHVVEVVSDVADLIAAVDLGALVESPVTMAARAVLIRKMPFFMA